jgi:hypothetical protein
MIRLGCAFNFIRFISQILVASRTRYYVPLRHSLVFLLLQVMTFLHPHQFAFYLFSSFWWAQ